MENSRLSKKISELLGPAAANSQKLELLDQTETDLEASLARYRALYKRVPNESIREKLESAFAGYQRSLDDFRERLFQVDGYESRLARLLEGLKRLKGAQFDFREELWEHSGPSTHPGINHLLSLLEKRDEDALVDQLEAEWERIDAQEKLLDKQPEFLQKVFRGLFKELRSLLDETAELLESRDWDELSELRADLWEWALDYSAHDVEGLGKKCCVAPTKLPLVNYALNARRLYHEEFLSRDFSDHIAGLAGKELRKFADWLDSQRERLDKHHVEQYHALNKELLGLLGQLPKTAGVKDVRELGQRCVGVADEIQALRLRCM